MEVFRRIDPIVYVMAVYVPLVSSEFRESVKTNQKLLPVAFSILFPHLVYALTKSSKKEEEPEKEEKGQKDYDDFSVWDANDIKTILHRLSDEGREQDRTEIARSIINTDSDEAKYDRYFIKMMTLCIPICIGQCFKHVAQRMVAKYLN